MSKLNEHNYVNIQSFMVRELGLKGNELIIYAIIFGFSQAEDTAYTGGLQYLCEWTNASKQTVINSLRALIDKDYISKFERTINGVKFFDYRSNYLNEVVKNFEWGGQKTIPENKIYNKEINKDISIRDDAPPERSKRFKPPTLEEVEAYCRERGNKVDASTFIAWYEANGWKVGRNPMKDWRAAVRTWESRVGGSRRREEPKAESFDVDQFAAAAMEKTRRQAQKLKGVQVNV